MKWLATVVGAIIAGVIVYWLTQGPLKLSERAQRIESQPTEVPSLATIATQDRVSVDAKTYWFPSGVYVRKADWINFIAAGQWWSGISKTDAAGDARPACGACPVPEARLGELVARIATGPPFRVGLKSTVMATQDGEIRLAMNDNTGPCTSNGEGSCYDDNNGHLTVRITVYRVK